MPVFLTKATSASCLPHPSAAIVLGDLSAVNSFSRARLRQAIESQPTDWFQRHNLAQSGLGGRRQFVGPGDIPGRHVFECDESPIAISSARPLPTRRFAFMRRTTVWHRRCPPR